MGYKISFDRNKYLGFAELFESGTMNDADEELCEFSKDTEDLAFEVAYTRYELAKKEKDYATLAAATRRLVEAAQANRYGTTLYLPPDTDAHRDEIADIFKNAANEYEAALAEVEALLDGGE